MPATATDPVPADPKAARAHDLALDLFGRKPFRRGVCARCGAWAERFLGDQCWKCVMVGENERAGRLRPGVAA